MPPPGPPALDAAGEGPGDAFGLAGRPGGGEYLGGAGGGGGSPFARYAAMVQQKAQQSVERQSRLRASRFRVTVKLWFEPDGSTQRVEIETSTGDAEIDKLLESVLLVAEVADLKAAPDRKAEGTVVEAELDKGRGPVATILDAARHSHVEDFAHASRIVPRSKSKKLVQKILYSFQTRKAWKYGYAFK